MENSKKSEYFFGNNLRFLRKSKKMTLVELSELVKISKSALSDYENGKFLPSLDIGQKLSVYFRVPIDKLYNSDISEKISNNFSSNWDVTLSKIANIDELAFENEKYIFNIKLLSQKLESIQLQIQMLKQLLDSREAENKTLKINIKLLEEQLRNFRE